MKKAIAVLLVLVLALSSGAFAAGKVTEKVQKLIDSNQSRLERTYAPRDAKPNYLGAQFGFPFMAGVLYSYNINQMFAIGVGGGSYFPGYAAGLDVKAFLLDNTIAPYVGGGIDYVGTTGGGFAAAHLQGGLDIALETGLCLNVGAVYMVSFNEADITLGTAWGADKKKLNDGGIQAGLGFRF